MGRDRSDVVSNLIIAEGQMEEAWYRCLSDGLGVFNESISGLEFALRDIELDGIRNLLSKDDQALWDMPPRIKERVERDGSTGNLANSFTTVKITNGWGVGDIDFLNQNANYWYWQNLSSAQT